MHGFLPVLRLTIASLFFSRSAKFCGDCPHPAQDRRKFLSNFNAKKFFAIPYPPFQRPYHGAVLIHEGRFSRRLGMRIGSGGRRLRSQRACGGPSRAVPGAHSPRATGVSGSGAFRVPNTIAPVWDSASGG
jgi:hypothetical protein